MTVPHRSEEESLRDALLDLERARTREAELRRDSEAILAGLDLLAQGSSPEVLFAQIFERFQPIVGFEQVHLLRRNRSGCWVPLHSSQPDLPHFELAEHQLFERVLDGQIVTAFDLAATEQFAGLSDNQQLQLGSGMLAAVHFEHTRIVVLCTHPERGRFGRSHARLAERFLPLLNQALRNVAGIAAQERVATLQGQREADQQHIRILEEGTRALGVGLFACDGSGHPKQPSETLLSMVSAWPSFEAWWAALMQAMHDAELELPLPAGVAQHVEVLDPDGHQRTFSLTSSRTDPGSSRLFPVLIADHTEAQESERRLDLAEKRYRALFQSSLDGILLFTLEGKLRESNQRAREMFGAHVEDLGTDWLQLHRSSAAQDAKHALSTLQAEGSVRYESDLQRIDGSFFTAEIAASVVDLGEERLVQALFRNVTLRKDTELRLRQSEARKSAVLEAALDCIISIDASGKIIEFNPAAESTLGWRREEVIGRCMADVFLPPDLRDAHNAGLQRFLKTGEARVLGKRLELPAVTKDGRAILTEAAITQTIGLEGQPVFTGFLRDITEQKAAQDALHQAKEEAEAASNAKSDFLASMSHELRTPLHVIAGMTEIAREHPLDGEMRELLSVIDSSSRSLLRLIDDLLDISRIEAGQLPIQDEDTDLNELLHELRQMFAYRVAEKGLELKWTIDRALPPHVRLDSARLRQILVNLLNNAVKFTDRGHIHFVGQTAVTRDGRADLCFEVRDTGQGFDESQREVLFERFEQLGRIDPRDKAKGVGLGLAISHGLANLMGGSLDARGEVGVGSTFSLRLPLALAERNVAEPDSPQRGSSSGRALDILVVDDHPDNRLLAERMLMRVGHRVRLAEDGETALRLVRESQPDLILMDVEMPGWSGFETTERLRAEYGDGLPIIALTAHAIQGFRDRCLSAGMNDYLSKPFARGDLIQAIERNLPIAGGSPEASPTPKLVLVDDDVLDLVPGYLERCADTTREARAAALRQDYESVRACAHKIKGSGSSYGFPRISELGTQLHAMAVGEVSDLAVEVADQLLHYLQEVRYQARSASSK